MKKNYDAICKRVSVMTQSKLITLQIQFISRYIYVIQDSDILKKKVLKYTHQSSKITEKIITFLWGKIKAKS